MLLHGCRGVVGGKPRRPAPVRTMFSFKNPCTVSPPSFSASGAAALRGFLHSLGTVNCELGGFVAWLKSFRMRSYRQTPCFARFWPKLSACNPFGMRSYKIAPANSFRMRSYEKRWGEDYVFPIFEFRVPNFACARRRRPYRRDSLLFHGRWNTVHAPRPGILPHLQTRTAAACPSSTFRIALVREKLRASVGTLVETPKE